MTAAASIHHSMVRGMGRSQTAISESTDRASFVHVAGLPADATIGSMPRSLARHDARLLCAVGFLLIGCGIVRTAVPAHVDLPVPTLHASAGAGLLDRGAAPDRRTAITVKRPVRLDLPTLGVRAPVVPVGVGWDGALSVPDNPHVIGWWAGGGEALVFDGHVDTATAGPGALFRITQLSTGDAVGLTGADGALQNFTITAVRAYPKAELPPDVFRPSATPRLVIITCGGHFDRRTLQYVDNVVAYAEPV